MIAKISSKFQFISNKAEILLNLLTKELESGDNAELEEKIQEFTDLVEKESISLAHAKLLKDSLIFLLRFYENRRIRSLIHELVHTIDNPFYKLRVRIEILKVMTRYEAEEAIVEEIKSIDEELERQATDLEQNAMNLLQKEFLTLVSSYIAEMSDNAMLEFILEHLERSTSEPYHDEIWRNVINNIYQLAITTDNQELASRLFDLSKTEIREKSFWAETLSNYGKFLKIKGRSKDVYDLINELNSIISETAGEFSRAIMLKESIKLTENVNEEPARVNLIASFKEKNEQLQGLFSSNLVRLQLLETYLSLDMFDKAKNIFLEIIKYASLINEDQLFLVIFNHLLGAVSKHPEIIDEEVVAYFVSKVQEIKDTGLKTTCLIHLAGKVYQFPSSVMKIKNIVEQYNKPLVFENMIYTDHMKAISRFLVQQAFQTENQEFINNAQGFIESATTRIEKCLLTLEFIEQFKKIGQPEQVEKFQELLLEQIGEIPNEFEKKDILVKLINFL